MQRSQLRLMLQNMQSRSSEAWREDVEKILGASSHGIPSQSHAQFAARRLQDLNGNGTGSGPTDTLHTNNIMGGISADQQLLLALQRNQLDSQSMQRLQSGTLDRETLLSLSSQAPSYGGLAAGNNAVNDRLLLQLLNERRQQSAFDPIQQELQRQALARELAEREYERTLLQRLSAVGGVPGGAGSLGLGNSTALAGLGAGADSTLGRSQASILEQARLSSLLGTQLTSPLLQGANVGLPAGVGPQGLARGAPGTPSFGFDDSITLEARSKQAFPLKLYRMLERAERNGQDDIISFIDDGKAFAIHKPRAFETDIMPSYFNSHRMSSFQRQLNIYVSGSVLLRVFRILQTKLTSAC